MANPIPTLSVVNYKGSGNVTVHKLLNGTTLDPAQDGSDVLAGNLEVPPATTNNHANRIVEAFGKRYLLHGERVYERDSGGSGNWGSIFSAENISSYEHSGLHLLHPGGVPTLCFLDWTQGSAVRKHTSTNGTSFVTDSNIATINGFADWIGPSIVFGNSIVWTLQGNTGGLLIHDLALDTTIQPALTGNSTLDTPGVDLLVHKNKLFIVYQGSNSINIDRLDGSSLTNIFLTTPFTQGGAVPTIFSDGDEIILFFNQFSAGDNVAYAITDPTGTPGSVLISTILDGITHTSPHGWNKYVSIDPDPTQATTYLWHNAGDPDTGTFDLYRYRYRQITHGAVTNGPFTLNEFVEQAGTGARGRVMESDGSSLDLTDVTGTFNNTGVITGDSSGAFATATSLLVYQTLVSLGSGISKANFGITNVSDGGLDRIPTAPSARPAFDGIPVEIAGGSTKFFFRVYGTGSAITLEIFSSIESQAPDTQVTLVSGSLVIESGAPPTTPSMSTTQITNVTPDSGATLYSFEADLSSVGITSGQAYNLLIDIV
jgi:hypothetical protein